MYQCARHARQAGPGEFRAKGGDRIMDTLGDKASRGTTGGDGCDRESPGFGQRRGDACGDVGHPGAQPVPLPQ